MSSQDRGLLRQTVYDSLKAMIVTGQLPSASRLTELELATKLKVSRTPIREALNKLEQDGLVVARPRQGFAVSDFDVDTMQETFDIREVLDGYATELATRRLTSDDKAKLKHMLADCEKLAALANRTHADKFMELQIGTDLHRTIARLSGNSELSNMLSIILDKCLHFIWLELTRLDDWKEARAEHAAIVEAMCEGNASLAGQLARAHIRSSRDNILELMRAKFDLQNFMAKAS